MTDQLRENSLRLHALKGAPRTPDALKFVLEMLESRPPGQQSLALQVLGDWGQPEDKERIKQSLIAACRTKAGRALSIRHVAIGALEHLVSQVDSNWLLQLCFSDLDTATRHDLFRLFKGLTPEVTRSDLLTQLKSPDWTTRWAAVRAIMAVKFPDQQELLTPLLEDSDRLVRETAKNGILQAGG
jgi:HEAT repeat protein